MTTEIAPEGIDTLEDVDVANTSGVVGDNVQEALDTLDVASAGGSLILLATATASASASIDFVSSIDSTYDIYEVHIISAIPATDNTEMILRSSSDGGSTFDSGASAYTTHIIAGTNGQAVQNSGGDTNSILLTNSGQNVGNAAGESINGIIRLYAPSNTALFTQFGINMNWLTADTDSGVTIGSGSREEAAIVNGLQLKMLVGDIISGEFKLYGVKKS